MSITRARAAIFCFLMGLCLCVPLPGQWQRVVYSGKGEFKDIPAPHPLSYFIANPFLRDDGDDLCADCTPQGKLNSARRYAIRTEVKPVGTLSGYRVFDALYHVSEQPSADMGQVKWKSILVEVSHDRYREIFHLQAFYTTISIRSSRIIQSGGEKVLATMDSDGGNGGGCWDGYWWFDSTGPHSLDFSELRAAIEKRVPVKTRFNYLCSSLDVKAQQVQSGVQRNDSTCHACDWVGEVTAQFRLKGALVVPLKVIFKAELP